MLGFRGHFVAARDFANAQAVLRLRICGDQFIQKALDFVERGFEGGGDLLVKGDLTSGGPVLVRMHALNVLDDVLHDRTSGHGGELESAMRLIGEAGRGVVVLLREARPTSVSERLKARLGNRPDSMNELRDYGVGAQILLDLGVREMILLSNTRRTIIGLEGYGLTVVGQRALTLKDAG